MPIEPSVNSIFDLNAAWPTAADPKSDGDDHLRMLKSILKITFPAFKGPMPIAHDQIASKDYVNQTAFTAALPGQANNAGKALFTDGTAASWQLVYPAQTSNAGKFLATDGASASWSNTLKASVIRFADGTDATKLAILDLSGLTTATTRTYTLPDASGTLALRTDSAMQLLASATVTTPVANINFLTVFTAAYDKYVIELTDMATVGTAIGLRVAVGGVAQATNYTNSLGANTSNINGSSAAFFLNLNSASAFYPLTVEIRGTNSAVSGKSLSARGAFNNSGSYTSSVVDGVWLGLTALSGFQLFENSGNTFSRGTVRVYGVKNS